MAEPTEKNQATGFSVYPPLLPRGPAPSSQGNCPAVVSVARTGLLAESMAVGGQ